MCPRPLLRQQLLKFRNSCNAYKDFLYLIPGAVIYDSGLRETENTLEFSDCILCALPVDAVSSNGRNRSVYLSDGIKLFLHLAYLVSAGAYIQIIAGP